MAATKRSIGKQDREHLPKSGAVLLDAGTTTARVADVMPSDRELTVITNATPISERLVQHPQLQVFLLEDARLPEAAGQVHELLQLGGDVAKARGGTERVPVGPFQVVQRRFGYLDTSLVDMCPPSRVGVERGHHEVSVAVGEHQLLPAVRLASQDEVLLADGVSCRTQLESLSERSGTHLAELLAARPPKP